MRHATTTVAAQHGIRMRVQLFLYTIYIHTPHDSHIYVPRLAWQIEVTCIYEYIYN